MFGQSTSIVVVYIDRNRLQFYGGKLSAILSLELPLTLVKDVEVTDRDALYTLINQWLKQNSLGSYRLFFVLSPTVYFEKILIETGETEQETEILQFYDSVPFDELITRVMTIDVKKHAIAANQEFLQAIYHAFTLQGLQIVAVVPSFALGPFSSKRWMDAEMGAYIVKHGESLKEQNIMEAAEQPLPVTPQGNIPTSKSNPRLMIMVGILGVLFLVLIFFIFTRH